MLARFFPFPEHSQHQEKLHLRQDLLNVQHKLATLETKFDLLHSTVLNISTSLNDALACLTRRETLQQDPPPLVSASTEPLSSARSSSSSSSASSPSSLPSVTSPLTPLLSAGSDGGATASATPRFLLPDLSLESPDGGEAEEVDRGPPKQPPPPATNPLCLLASPSHSSSSSCGGEEASEAPLLTGRKSSLRCTDL